MHDIDSNTVDDDAVPTPQDATSRRSLVGKGLIAAAVGAAAGIAASERTSAADGDPIRIGQANAGTTTTGLATSGSFWVWGGGGEGQAAIYGLTGGTFPDANFGVHGESSVPDGAGVLGSSDAANGTAIFAAHNATDSGSGVGLNASSTNGTGIVASGPEADIRLGGSSVVQFAGEGVGGTGPGTAGELATDGGGTLFFCYETGVGNWRRLAGPTTAGSYNPVTPFRAYDSRSAAPAPGALRPGEDRVVSLADSRDGGTGAVISPNVIPAGATAVTFNLTVVNTVGRGFLAVTEGDATSTESSSINWSESGAIVANAATVKLDTERRIRVFNSSAGTTNFIIDVTGFYL